MCPALRKALFKKNRSGYVDLKVDKADIKAAIYEHPEFALFIDQMNQHFDLWRKKIAKRLCKLVVGAKPKQIIGELSEDLLVHYTADPVSGNALASGSSSEEPTASALSLIDAYHVYQHLMDYWSDVMQDDVYQIAAPVDQGGGWKAETYRILVKDKKGKERDKGWACDLVPKRHIVARYFADQQAAIDQLQAELENVSARQTELEEEHGGEEGFLTSVGSKTDAEAAWREAFDEAWQSIIAETYGDYADAVAVVTERSERLPIVKDDPRIQALKNEKGNVTKGGINKQLKVAEGDELELLNEYVACDAAIKESKKTAKALLESATELIADKLNSEPDDERLSELRVLKAWLDFTEQIADLKKQIKDAEAELDDAAQAKYPELTEDEVKSLVVDDKWLTRLDADVHGEMDRISQSLTQRVKELTERYGTPLPQLSDRVTDLEEKVSGHLERMGFGVNEAKLAEVGT